MIFWKLRERPFRWCVKNKVYFWPVFDKIPWTHTHTHHGIFLKIGNYGPFQIWDLSIPSERAPSKLSENQKIVEFGPSELCKVVQAHYLRDMVIVQMTLSLLSQLLVTPTHTPPTHPHHTHTHTGPGPLEALAHGCVFLQPSFSPPHSGLNTVSMCTQPPHNHRNKYIILYISL